MDYTSFESPLYSVPPELKNSMVSFEVSIGSLDMNILEGIKKQLLNSALYDLKNYTADLSILNQPHSILVIISHQSVKIFN